MDVTNRSAAADVARLAPVVGVGALVHTYTEDEVLLAFPGLRELASIYTDLTHKPYRRARGHGLQRLYHCFCDSHSLPYSPL